MKRRKEGREKERKQWHIQDFLDEVGGIQSIIRQHLFENCIKKNKNWA